MSDFWNDQLVANDRQWLFLVLAGIIVSFGLIRISTRLMRSPRTPWWPGSIVSEGGVHVHHLVFGIVLMMIAGVGIGLTIDEFAALVIAVSSAQAGGSRMRAALTAAALVLLAAPGAAQAGARDDARVQRGLDGLVKAEAGPPGVIATLYRDGKTTVLRAGYADRTKRRRPRSTDHMRIASVAKAFSGAVALRLVRDGQLGLDDTVARHRPDLPAAWGAVTVRQLLNHTSGVPDYTKSKGFVKQFQTAPKAYVSPAKIISWVARDKLVFRPGSRYEYSNTDNIIVGLIAERITSRSYGAVLDDLVFGPLGLSQTSFPRSTPLPRPFIHGYVTEPGKKPDDVSTLLSPSGAWASGAIVSTPRNLSTFMRGYVSGRLFGTAARRQQRRFVPGGRSSPPGPGANSAGLALFRYRTRCGIVYGHTGNFPGYVQWAAASSDGQRVVTTSLNIPAPEGALLRRLRAVQEDAVCALLRD